MRNLLLSAALVLSAALCAQVPQAFDFQGVARNASGNVLSTQSVSVRLSVHSGSANGPVVYSETHAVITNAFGLFSVAVGGGSVLQGTFSTIDWSSASHFLQVELDASGGSTYLDMGTTQLLSVPYALHAGGIPCATVSMLGDTLRQSNGCYVIIPGLSAANGGCIDLDQDGFYDKPVCNTPVDCNDNLASVNPGAEDLCGDGIDQDCSGTPDDNVNTASWVDWHPDVDGDGFGNEAITVSACAAPQGHISTGGDCNDGDANIFPGQGCSSVCTSTEVAWVDANFLFYVQSLQSAWVNCFFGSNTESCMQENLEGYGVPLSQGCNSCGITWIGCVQVNCFGECITSQEACDACGVSSGCTATLIQCLGLIDADGDGVPVGSDCDDNNPQLHAGAQELCDDIDNDCDGLVDEGNACCPDNDADGFTTCDGDCDDEDLNNNPGAGEVCDGQDNNCNGMIDEGVLNFLDADSDGFGDPTQPLDCIFPGVSNDLDCDDQNADVNFNAIELCDGLDNDCNGQIDESCPQLGQPCDGPDDDGCANGVIGCDGFGGCTCIETGPGNEELCNGEDDDCDGAIDEDGVCPE